MSDAISADSVSVVIAGAGPVGLTLAADLAHRGVRGIVVDPQLEVHPHPRAISIGVRSMEHFRRMGLADRVIDAGVPRAQVLDVVYVTRMLGHEIFRFRFPSIDDLQANRPAWAREIAEVAASPYFKTWTAQSPLEESLRAHLRQSPLVDLRLGWRLREFTQTDAGVAAVITHDASGESRTIQSRWLVGCDGANSVVRAGLGVRLEGKGTLGEACGIYFCCAQLRQRLGAARAVMYWVLASGCSGTIYTINGTDTWVYNRYYRPGEAAAVADPVALVREALGAALDIEILSVQNWLPRQLVAERYGAGRVFLAGDACHLFVPTGGFGMNTGIGDAADLAWKIAAVEAGWGGARLLDTYDIERRPVGTFNTLEAADNHARSGDLFQVPAALESDDAAGEAARAAIAARLPPKIKHFAPIGVHLGYRYEGSPLIVPDGTPAPPMETANYSPTARPGHRAPHAWLAEGRSTLDLFGEGFVLLRLGANPPEVEALLDAARAANLPLRVHAIKDAAIAQLYARALVLVRPDGHVAWRGDTLPERVETLIATVAGQR